MRCDSRKCRHAFQYTQLPDLGAHRADPLFVGIYYLPDSAISAEDKNLVATVTFIAPR
jgi:hypothetical protein